MIYAVSNIHGNYEKFKALIDKIRLKDDDVLYLLGDIVDYGEDPIGLILDISMRYNVLPILGEHDYRALRMLTELDKMLSGAAPDPEIIGEMTEWIADGGAKTMEGFKALDSDMREGVLDYLSDMALYEQVEAGGKSYLLVHAGITDFDPDTPLEDYLPEDFINDSPLPDTEYFRGVTTVVGHIPTYSVEGATAGKIFKTKGAYFIDCGAAFGEALGCICLDNGKEYYI